MLLDVSTRADQMGVTLGPSIVVDRDERGDAKLRTAGTTLFGTTSSTTGLPLQIMNMDVVTTARHVRAATLPQISWEPVWNVPLPIEGSARPIRHHHRHAWPGRVRQRRHPDAHRLGEPVSGPDCAAAGDQARHQGVQRPPDSATGALGVQPAVRHDRPGRLQPADREPAGEERAARSQHAPLRPAARGAADQGAARRPRSSPTSSAPRSRAGRFSSTTSAGRFSGLRLYGSTLGKTVRDGLQPEVHPADGDDPHGPARAHGALGIRRVDLQQLISTRPRRSPTSARFSSTSIVGRTGHEVVQIRSILYPFGVHVVRTITLMRSNNGYVFRSDSGWKAESDGFYNFDYTLDLKAMGEVPVSNPYEFHAQPVKGVSNVREIRDFPDGGPFTSSFQLDDPDLPPELQALIAGRNGSRSSRTPPARITSSTCTCRPSSSTPTCTSTT